MHSCDPHPGSRTGEQRRYAQLTVVPYQRLILGRVDQVALVEAQNRRDLALLGAGQIAVDEVRLEVRLNDGHDDDDLIHIGDDDVLPAARRARQHAVPRFDPFDEPFRR